MIISSSTFLGSLKSHKRILFSPLTSNIMLNKTTILANFFIENNHILLQSMSILFQEFMTLLWRLKSNIKIILLRVEFVCCWCFICYFTKWLRICTCFPKFRCFILIWLSWSWYLEVIGRVIAYCIVIRKTSFTFQYVLPVWFRIKQKFHQIIFSMISLVANDITRSAEKILGW